MLREKYAQEIEAILAKYPVRRSAILPLLYLVQQEYGYCTEEGIREVAEITGVSPTEVREVVGFYTLFYDHPIGRHLIQICDRSSRVPCGARRIWWPTRPAVWGCARARPRRTAGSPWRR